MTIAVLGEAIIDLIMSPQGHYHPHLGGSPYNVTVGLARQNEVVSYLSPLSSDSFGDALHSKLLMEGVHIPMTTRSPRPTSIALITTNAENEPAYRLYREGIADKDFSISDIKSQLPSDLTLMHTGSLAITPSQLPKIRELLRIMQQLAIPVSLDINVRLGASVDVDTYLAGIRSLLPFADIVKASAEDLAPFRLAADAMHAAEIAFQEQGKGILVLTQGAGETVLFTGNKTFKQKPPIVTDIQDTIGAGDSFYAAFLACFRRRGLCHLAAIHNPADYIGDSALMDSLRYANAAAAINLSRSGCSPPTQAQVEAFLDETGNRR